MKEERGGEGKDMETTAQTWQDGLHISAKDAVHRITFRREKRDTKEDSNDITYS